MEVLNSKDTKIPIRTILIAAGLIIWLAVLIFIISLYSIDLQFTPMWKFRFLILYGFMVLGGMVGGFIGEKKNFSYIITALTFIVCSFTDYLWHKGGFGVWSWRILVLFAGFGVGKLIMYFASKKFQPETLLKDESRAAPAAPSIAAKSEGKPKIKFRNVRYGIVIVVVLIIAYAAYDLGVNKGINLAKIMTRPERQKYTKHGFMEIKDIDASIVLNKPEWFDTMVVRLPRGLVEKELNRFIYLEYDEFGSEDWRRAIKSYYYVMSLDPIAWHMNRIMIGHCYRRSGDWQRALAEYITAHDNVPQKSPDKIWYTCYSLYEAAWCYVMLEDYENAAATFEKCCEFAGNPDDGARNCARESAEIIALIRLKQYDEVRKRYIN